MTQVDFYLLKSSDSLAERDLFACRLINRAFRAGNEIYLAAASQTHAEALDELLWREPNSGFIPHTLNPTVHETVNIGYNCEPEKHQDCLVNLSQGIPEYSARFERICEIVIYDTSIYNMTRKHYKYYKDRGFPIRTHEIAAKVNG